MLIGVGYIHKGFYGICSCNTVKITGYNSGGHDRADTRPQQSDMAVNGNVQDELLPVPGTALDNDTFEKDNKGFFLDAMDFAAKPFTYADHFADTNNGVVTDELPGKLIQDEDESEESKYSPLWHALTQWGQKGHHFASDIFTSISWNEMFCISNEIPLKYITCGLIGISQHCSCNGLVPHRRQAITWWRHQMETFSALLAICAGNSPVTGEFPTQKPVAWALMFSLIYTWIYGWVNNREAGGLRRHRAHYDVIVMTSFKDGLVYWCINASLDLVELIWACYLRFIVNGISVSNKGLLRRY